MILDCVLTACNEVSLYLDFVPYFIKTWKKLYPNVDVKVIVIANTIPDNLIKYQDNLILFPPLDNISTAFISQYIRLLYPSILDYKNGILITDIDMIPMNRTYYTKNIENIPDNKFIYMRDVMLEDKEIAMCYNVALNVTWKEIFGINNLDDIINRLKNVYNSIEYIDGHNNTGWNIDQIHFYNCIMKWNNETNNFIILSDKNTNFSRLCRDSFMQPNNLFVNLVKNGYFTDYHCLRPYTKFKDINEFIYDLL